MNSRTKKNNGAFYTCNAIAEYIAKNTIDNSTKLVLEPSFGDGIFIDAANARFAELGKNSSNIIGIELQAEKINSRSKADEKIFVFQMNFLDYKSSKKVSCVIGNPPYIRLKNLSADEKSKALNLMSSYGVDMQSSGSLWMPFIVHSAELLETGGKLGFVVPYEITHVKYAVDLWKYLSRNFGKITVCRIYRDFFPEVDVETVIFFAEDKGNSTNFVDCKICETVADLRNDKEKNFFKISVDDIIESEKPFARAMIPDIIEKFLCDLRQSKKISKLLGDCKFKIGYVTGSKEFFHLSESDRLKNKIDAVNVKKCLINAKQINSNTEVGTETKNISQYSQLFYPIEVGEGEKNYIRFGENIGINERYKCRTRNIWYLTPDLKIPDFILTVFGDVPKLMINDGKFYISNSLLGGFSNLTDPKELICRWYNSLTLLSIEINIHSLGGGTLVLIPGETDKLEIISDFPPDKIETAYKKIADFAKKNTTDAVYKYGDEVVLKEIYNFSDEIISSIQETCLMFRHWRNPEKRRSQ